jgi:membrane associated rhomboid family serine protease
MLPVRDHLPTRITPFVNYALVAANVVVFAIEVYSPPEVTESWALVPATLASHPFTLISHMFVHAGLAHIAGNMLFLWIFGDNVEDALGHLRYAVLYLVCGISAALAQVAMGPHSTVPMVGASGAISGVLAAYLLLYPRSPITVINPIPILWIFWGLFLWLPAWFVIITFFLMNLWHTIASAGEAGGGGVAFAAHCGGFVVGLVLEPLLRKHEPVEADTWSRFVRR